MCAPQPPTLLHQKVIPEGFFLAFFLLCLLNTYIHFGNIFEQYSNLIIRENDTGELLPADDFTHSHKEKAL